MGDCPLSLSPSSASGTSPSAITVPVRSLCGLWALSGASGQGPCGAVSWALPRGHPHAQQEGPQGPGGCCGAPGSFYEGQRSPPAPRSQPGLRGCVSIGVAAAGLGLGLRSSEPLAGGRVNTARSGARGILLTALSSGLGGAAQARGGGPKARVVSPPCPRPPADCGASPAVKDSGRGSCWRLSSQQRPPTPTWDPRTPHAELLFS